MDGPRQRAAAEPRRRAQEMDAPAIRGGQLGRGRVDRRVPPVRRAAPRVDVQQVGQGRAPRRGPHRVSASGRTSGGLGETEIHGAIADEVEAPPDGRAGASAAARLHREIAADERIAEPPRIDLDRQPAAADGVIAPEFRHREIDARRQKPAERPLHAVRANEALEIRVRAAGVAQEPGIGALGPRVDGAPHQLEKGLGARLETAP